MCIGSRGTFADPQDQPSPVSVLDSPFICDSNRRLLYSSEAFITASPRKAGNHLIYFFRMLFFVTCI